MKIYQKNFISIILLIITMLFSYQSYSLTIHRTLCGINLFDKQHKLLGEYKCEIIKNLPDNCPLKRTLISRKDYTDENIKDACENTIYKNYKYSGFDSDYTVNNKNFSTTCTLSNKQGEKLELVCLYIVY